MDEIFYGDENSGSWQKFLHPIQDCFRCTLVLAWPDGHDEIFEGVLAGQVVWPPRGLDGHGYDPIFQPDGYDITCGEMSFENKNKVNSF